MALIIWFIFLLTVRRELWTNESSVTGPVNSFSVFIQVEVWTKAWDPIACNVTVEEYFGLCAPKYCIFKCSRDSHLGLEQDKMCKNSWHTHRVLGEYSFLYCRVGSVSGGITTVSLGSWLLVLHLELEGWAERTQKNVSAFPVWWCGPEQGFPNRLPHRNYLDSFLKNIDDFSSVSPLGLWFSISGEVPRHLWKTTKTQFRWHREYQGAPWSIFRHLFPSLIIVDSSRHK